MARNNRIFISFAIEDAFYRDGIVKQAKDERCPFSFVDMSVKEPWDSAWKTMCRTRIKGCDGLIAMLSANTAKATGQLWEIQCAREEGVPVLGVYIFRDKKPSVPRELQGCPAVEWTWSNIANFIDRLP